MEVAAATVEGEKYSLWCELGWKKSHPRENKRTEEKKKDDTDDTRTAEKEEAPMKLPLGRERGGK